MSKKTQFRLLSHVISLVRDAKRAREALTYIHGKGVDIDVREVNEAVTSVKLHAESAERLLEELKLR